MGVSDGESVSPSPNLSRGQLVEQFGGKKFAFAFTVGTIALGIGFILRKSFSVGKFFIGPQAMIIALSCHSVNLSLSLSALIDFVQIGFVEVVACISLIC